MPPLTRSTRDLETTSEPGERSHPDPKSFDKGMALGVDVNAIIRTVTTQLGYTLDEHFQQLAVTLTPHNVTTESESQQQQQVEAEATKATNLACQCVFQRYGWQTLPANEPDDMTTLGHLEPTTSNGLQRPTIKPDNIRMYDGSTDNLEFFLGHIKSLIESH